MKYLTRAVFCALTALALPCLSGCGGGGKKYEVRPVHGKISFNDAPMKGGGSVVFLPIDGGKEASGEIAEDGTFSLSTYEPEDGAAPGEYRVVIYQITTKEPEITSDDGDGETAPDATIYTVEKKDRIPQIYSDVTNSPLKKTVLDSATHLKIDLKPYTPPKNKGA